MSTKRTKSKVRKQLKQDQREDQRFLRDSRKRQGLVEKARKRRDHLIHTLGGMLLKIDPSEIANSKLREYLIEVFVELEVTDEGLRALGLKSQKRNGKRPSSASTGAGSAKVSGPAIKSHLASVTVGFRTPPSEALLANLKSIRFSWDRDDKVWRGRADPEAVKRMIRVAGCQELVRLFEPSG